eukprot:10993863-Heterocapsa_arctica.AAC.1
MSAVLLVHKYRRAPFGGGKFLRQAQGALQVCLRPGNVGFELFERYLPMVSRELDMASTDAEAVALKALGLMLETAGSKVEMRRWWTHYDASIELLPLWTTMLVALLGQEMLGGRD